MKHLYSKNQEDWMSGADIMVDTVTQTLGPFGNNIGIQRLMDTPFWTKDGAMVAKELVLPDPIQNFGARLIADAAQKTAVEAGDGTTTTVAITGGIIKNFDIVANKYGVDRARLYYRVSEVMKMVSDWLKTKSKPMDSKELLEDVVRISLNGDTKLTELVVSAYDQNSDLVILENGYGVDSYLSQVRGYKFEQGVQNALFNNNIENSCLELDNCYILAFRGLLSNPKFLLPLFEQLSGANKAFVVIGSVVGAALDTLAINKMKGLLNCAVLLPPYSGWKRDEFWNDLELISGCEVYDLMASPELSVTMDELGLVKKIVSKNNSTIVISEDERFVQDNIDARIAYYENKKLSCESTFDTEFCSRNIAYLSGGTTSIHIAGQTETEQRDNRLKVEDAVSAARVAGESGILPGCGIALAKVGYAIKKKDKKFFKGSNILSLFNDDIGKAAQVIVSYALQNPFRLLASNAGESNEVWERIGTIYKKDFWTTYDYSQVPPKIGNALDLGVVDPLGVVISALNNATAVGQMVKMAGVHISDYSDTEA